MTQQEWARVKEIFDAAMSCPPPNRATLLARECHDDEKLRAEVERLLAHFDSVDDFLDAAVMRLPSLVAKIEGPTRVFAEGELVSGRFRIARRIGVGGMGEVYQAEDLALGGQIAIKTIRPEISMDVRNLARFKREIQLSRNITHPNVCRVYDIATTVLSSGFNTTYLTMEMVHGETLAVMLEKHGPLNMSAALPLMRQMAAALDAAHRVGIIHRDFKPSNVIVAYDEGSERRVVVTDFGLASSINTPDALDSMSLAHGLLGTPAYMAPEQLEGDPATTATDVYAFGLVLYEMLTGRRTFAEEANFAGVLARLKSSPLSPRAVRPDLDPSWEELILRCLERDPARRFANASELAAAIEKVPSRSSAFERANARRGSAGFRRFSSWQAALGATLVFGSGAAWLAYWAAGAATRMISIDNAQFIQLTTAPGQELYPTFSPNGEDLVYAGQSGQHWHLYLLRIRGKEVVDLTADSAFDNTEPSISPDGRLIAFRSERDGGGVFLMPTSGGPARRLASVGYLPSWSPDGEKLVCSTSSFTLAGRGDVHSRMVILDVKTGSQHYPNLDDDAVQPSWSPHGSRIAYWRLQGGRRDICTIPAEGGVRICITNDSHLNWNPVWSPDGRYLLFSSDRSGTMNLWRAPIDEHSGNLTGDFVPLTTPSTYSGYLGISRDGNRLAYVQLVYSSQLEAVGFDPRGQDVTGPSRALTQSQRVACCPNVSPDGQWVAFGTGGGEEGISLIRSDGTNERVLTSSAHRNRQPRWSPKGDLIAFTSSRGGTSEIWTMRPDGTALRQLTADERMDVRFCAWSPDGTRLFYDVRGDAPRMIKVDEPATPQISQHLPRPDGPNSEFRATNWSPDGSEIVGAEFRADGSRAGLLIYSVRAQSYQRLTTSGNFAVWLKDGHSLLYDDDGGIFLVDEVHHGRREILRIPAGAVQDDFSLSPDERTIYFRLTHTEADVWMAVRHSGKLEPSPIP